MNITQGSVGMGPLSESPQHRAFVQQNGSSRAFPLGGSVQTELIYRFAVKVDRLNCRTFVRMEVSIPGAFRNAKDSDWDRYLDACRQNLYRVVTGESVELRVWSSELDEASETIIHSVALGGEVWGAVPLHVIRAVQPPPEYRTIQFLARAVQSGSGVEPMLKAYAEFEKLQVRDRHSRRLQDPIPAQLLAIALFEPGWRKLIGPLDRPWAYINTVTQRLYERHYQEDSESCPMRAEASARDSHPIGDELGVENQIEVFRAAGCGDEEMKVLLGRAAGKKWNQLPQYLTLQTGHPWDARRVHAARGKLRRSQGKVRTAGIAGSHWKRATTHTGVYRERLPDGAEWNGLWTWDHTYQGEELETLRDVMREERSRLFSKK
jgi:hypothetical protein